MLSVAILCCRYNDDGGGDDEAEAAAMEGMDEVSHNASGCTKNDFNTEIRPEQQ